MFCMSVQFWSATNGDTVNLITINLIKTDIEISINLSMHIGLIGYLYTFALDHATNGIIETYDALKRCYKSDEMETFECFCH